MNTNTKDLSFINFNNEEMQWVKFNGVIVYEAWRTLIASGVPPLTLTKCKGVNLLNYKLYGNSIQDGEPTPTTPIEVESVGEYDETTRKYKILVKTSGKNLFNINNLTSNNNLIKDGNGTITVSKYGVSTIQTLAQLCPELKVGDKVRLSFVSNTEFNGAPLNLLYLNGANVNWINRNILTITQAHLDSKFTFYCSRNDSVNTDSYYKNMQIEYDTVTDYEPYQEPIATNIYLNEPLRKIGDYADYIDFKNKKVVRNIKELILDGSYSVKLDNWRKVEGYYAVGYAQNTFPDIYKTNDKGYILCEQLANITYGTMYGTTKGVEGISNNSSSSYSMFIRLKTDSITTKGEFLEYLNANPLNINYVLATPTEETIELPSIPTLKGTTILNVDTTIQPSNLEVTYKGKK